MLRSMTAFARVNTPAKEGNWVVEIRSVNHRYFEFSLKLPPDFYSFEDRIRDLFHSRIARGKITLSVNQNTEAENSDFEKLTLNEAVVRKYLGEIGKLKKQFRISGEISLSDVVSLPGLFTFNKTKVPAEKKWALLQKAIQRSLDKVVLAKQAEGGRIIKDVAARLQSIRKTVKKIEQSSVGRADFFFEKLKKNISQLLETEVKDEERLWREVAFLAEKSDITEEIVRMKSHLQLFEKRIQSHSEVGRELDFLCQEMHREVNTMGSKSQLFEISREVVFIKGEIEKIREQIQNIE